MPPLTPATGHHAELLALAALQHADLLSAAERDAWRECGNAARGGIARRGLASGALSEEPLAAPESAAAETTSGPIRPRLRTKSAGAKR